jgi:16S rRNA (guanine1516-N2)-methyltransferase
VTAPRCGATRLAPTLPAALRDGLAGALPATGTPVFTLTRDAEGLALVDGDGGLLRCDYLAGRTGWRGDRAGSERLVRACGAARRPPPRLVDGTGGLGTDAWLLAAAGATVVLVEQHPVLRALIADGLERARTGAPEVVERLTMVGGDVREHLTALAPDGLYLDPMYPARRKRALGDGRLRRLAALLEADGLRGDAAAELVAAGLAAGIPRVVLKRPVKERVDAPRPPSHHLEGRSTRFDVWVSSSA